MRRVVHVVVPLSVLQQCRRVVRVDDGDRHTGAVSPTGDLTRQAVGTLELAWGVPADVVVERVGVRRVQRCVVRGVGLLVEVRRARLRILEGCRGRGLLRRGNSRHVGESLAEVVGRDGLVHADDTGDHAGEGCRDGQRGVREADVVPLDRVHAEARVEGRRHLSSTALGSDEQTVSGDRHDLETLRTEPRLGGRHRGLAWCELRYPLSVSEVVPILSGSRGRDRLDDGLRSGGIPQIEHEVELDLAGRRQRRRAAWSARMTGSAIPPARRGPMLMPRQACRRPRSRRKPRDLRMPVRPTNGQTSCTSSWTARIGATTKSDESMPH